MSIILRKENCKFLFSLTNSSQLNFSIIFLEGERPFLVVNDETRYCVSLFLRWIHFHTDPRWLACRRIRRFSSFSSYVFSKSILEWHRVLRLSLAKWVFGLGSLWTAVLTLLSVVAAEASPLVDCTSSF